MNFMKGLLGNHIKWQHWSIHQLCSALILRLCSRVICSVLTFHSHHFQAMSFALVSDISAAPESTQLLVIKFFQKKSLRWKHAPRIPKPPILGNMGYKALRLRFKIQEKLRRKSREENCYSQDSEV